MLLIFMHFFMQIVEPLCNACYTVELNKLHSLGSKILTSSAVAHGVQTLYERHE